MFMLGLEQDLSLAQQRNRESMITMLRACLLSVLGNYLDVCDASNCTVLVLVWDLGVVYKSQTSQAFIPKIMVPDLCTHLAFFIKRRCPCAKSWFNQHGVVAKRLKELDDGYL